MEKSGGSVQATGKGVENSGGSVQGKGKSKVRKSCKKGLRNCVEVAKWS